MSIRNDMLRYYRTMHPEETSELYKPYKTFFSTYHTNYNKCYIQQYGKTYYVKDIYFKSNGEMNGVYYMFFKLKRGKLIVDRDAFSWFGW